MSRITIEHWRCDFCGVEVKRGRDGLPRGWTWEQEANAPITHWCGFCEKLPPLHQSTTSANPFTTREIPDGVDHE